MTQVPPSRLIVWDVGGDTSFLHRITAPSLTKVFTDREEKRIEEKGRGRI